MSNKAGMIDSFGMAFTLLIHFMRYVIDHLDNALVCVRRDYDVLAIG